MSRAAVLRLCLSFAAALPLAGCGKDNDLHGSVSELFSLGFSRVDVYRNSDALQVSYYANRGPDVDLVIRLAVAVGDLQLENHQKIPLDGEYAPGHARTSVVHMAGGEAMRTFPPVSKGDLVFTSGATSLEGVRGNFDMSFIQTSDYGGGRSLGGSFATAFAKDASFDPCPTPPCPAVPATDAGN
jgi:hypothetical protein